MKLKQAFAIGLSSAILALPAFAAESATTAANLTPATQQDAVKPMKKEAFHKKGHKKCPMKNNLEAKQAKENAQLDELNAVNSGDAAKN